MSKEEGKKYTLCMYDVRGIQEYIFRTNRLRHVIGASYLVENFFQKGIGEVSKALWTNKDHCYVTDWCWPEKEQHPKLRIEDNEDIEMEVLYIGGGNALILFRKKQADIAGNLETSILFNRKFSHWILDQTYTLRLAIAKIDTYLENYSDDYKMLLQEMQRVKANMPSSEPFTGFPFVAREAASGRALSDTFDYTTSQYVSRETASKLRALDRQVGQPTEGKHLDDLVSLKGDDSWLAFVHIDGNSVGRRIKEILEKTNKQSYSENIQTMRSVSCSISQGFETTYVSMKEALDKTKADPEEQLIRKVILAGDDITFVCNANVAISLVKFFLEEVSKKYMYTGENEAADPLYAFSACAGIAFANSHFPFYEAYQIAEACCSSAKKSAKAKENAIIYFDTDGQEHQLIGCWVDFQFCDHINIIQLEKYRRRQYLLPDGTYLLKRPYWVPDGETDGRESFSDEMSASSIENLIQRILALSDKKENTASSEQNSSTASEQDGHIREEVTGIVGVVPRRWCKKAREAYTRGKAALTAFVAEAETRHRHFPINNENAYMDNVATYYDAIELADHFQDLALKGPEGF